MGTIVEKTTPAENNAYSSVHEVNLFNMHLYYWPVLSCAMTPISFCSDHCRFAFFMFENLIILVIVVYLNLVQACSVILGEH